MSKLNISRSIHQPQLWCSHILTYVCLLLLSSSVVAQGNGNWQLVSDASIEQGKRVYVRGSGYYTDNTIQVTNAELLSGPYRLVLSQSTYPVINASGENESQQAYFDVANTDETIRISFANARGRFSYSTELYQWVSSAPEQHDSGLYVQPIAGLQNDFIKGADISTLIEVEQHGGVFYDESGNQQDVIQMLAEHGVNWVRLRLWNDPYDVSWIEQEFGSTGSSTGMVGGGTNDLNKAIALAKRAKAAGMKVLLDFHYSDFWTDPGKQYIPDAWKDLVETTSNNGTTQQDCSAVNTALYDFTRNTLLMMNDEDVFPDMIQVGNEINNGLVYPCGSWHYSDINSYSGGIALLSKGVEAINDVESMLNKQTLVMLHLADGGSAQKFRLAFTAFDNANLNYDIIGASYYPFWHGTLDELQNNLNQVSAQTGKPVIVAEMAYGFTTAGNDDPTPNIFSDASADAGGFLATVQGQATAVREVMNVVANVPDNKGLGMFYWEPTWIPIDGAGWITGAGNGWENQAMFDYQGQVLDSLDVFWKVSSTDPVDAPTVVSADDISLTISANQNLDLPAYIKALYTDDAYRYGQVIWDNAGAIDTSVAGTYQVSGQVDNAYAINATVIVLGNAMTNGGFEENSLAPWQMAIDTNTFIYHYTDSADNIYAGNKSVNFWFSSAGISTMSQTQPVENGTYVVTLKVSGESTGTSASMLQVNGVSASITLAGWKNWTESRVEVEVTNGILEVIIRLDESDGSWGFVDDVLAVKQAQ